MAEIKKCFILFLLPLLFTFSVFSCTINKWGESCGNYRVDEGSFNSVCLIPEPPTHELIPIPTTNINVGFPKTFDIESIKNSKETFNKEYGGCSLSYSNKKISANFKYTTGTETDCSKYGKGQQVNKFKCYCDDGFSDFDFSTSVRVTYHLIGGNCHSASTQPPCKQYEDISIGPGGESIEDKINDIKNLVSRNDPGVGSGNFGLKISAEITDDKCGQDEKNIGKLKPPIHITLSNQPKEIDEEEKRQTLCL